MNIQERIAAQRAKIDGAEPVEFTVIVGGEETTLTIKRIEPTAWADLAASHKPRPGSTDDGVGYNQESLPADYPVTHITVDGESIDQATWRDLYKVLDPTHKATIGNVIWGQNVYPAIKELIELGKAKAGKRSGSPARKGSRRAAGSGGSRRK